MADSYKVANHQKVSLLALSRSSGFGAKKNKSPDVSQSAIDENWHEIETKGYNFADGPFTRLGGYSNFKRYSGYDHVPDTKQYDSYAFAGALEYLADIRPIVRIIREKLIQGKKVDLFIGYGGGYYAWTTRTAKIFLSAMGIKIRATSKVSSQITKLSLECSKSDYEDFLREANLPGNTFSHLMVTTEHSGYRVTGGIGSYVKECDTLYGDDAAILILDNNTTLDTEKIEANKWLVPQSFLGFDRVDKIMASNFDAYGDVVEETLECILALYPNIETIESQEMLLNRSIDAKSLAILPQDIKLITTCHGSSFHLAKAKRTVLDAENIHVAYREKYTLEYSDIVFFPTDYLRRSYMDSGIQNLTDVSRIKRRLPFDLARLPEGKKIDQYERLLYIGKTSTIKGFDLFLESLLEMHEHDQDILQQIKEVVIMATSVEITEPYLKSLYNKVKSLYNVQIVSLDREVLLKTLAEYSENTLALITYRGDNHPLAVLELMAIGHDFIAANAAGTPELILQGFEEHNLAPASAKAYASAVRKALRTPSNRSKRVTLLREHYIVEQKKINEGYTVDALRTLLVHKQKVLTAPSTDRDVQVIISGVEKNSASYLATRSSLENQTYEHIEIEPHTINKSALQMRLHAGDVLYPQAVELMVKMHAESEDIGVVLADQIVMSYEGDGVRKGFEEFHPYAPELGSVFLQEKYSRRVIGLFDGEYLSDSFTDWQKCIAASCEGKRVGIVPQLLLEAADIEGYFKNDTNALSSNFAHSFTALPVFDAGVLYSELERFDQIYWGLRPVGHMGQYFVSSEVALRAADISPKIIRIIGAYHRFTPKPIKRTISILGEITFSLLRKIKGKVRQ